MTEVLEVKEEKIVIDERPPVGEERVFTERPPGVAPIKPEFIVKVRIKISYLIYIF